MTDSLLPERLPEGWRGARLRWVSKIYAGGTPSRERPDYWDEGTIPWLNSGAVNDWAIREPSEYITKAGLAGSSARWIPASSVVMALAGQGKTKGTAARLEIETTCNQSMAALVPQPTLDHRFLHFWLAANYESIRNLGGGDLRDGLNLQVVGDIEILLPPVEEQRRIADFLDDQVARIDSLISLRGAQIDRGDELLDSMMAAAIQGAEGLPLRRVVAKWIDYRGATPSKTESGRQLVTASNVTSGTITFDRVSEFIGEADYWSWMRRGFPKIGDVLFTTEAPLGQVAILKRTDVALAQRVILLRPDPSYVSSEWLYWSLRSPAVQAEIRAQATGSTAAGIKAARLRGIQIPVPERAQQDAQSLALRELSHALNESTELLESFITLLEERKRSLITAAVTGEMDVTTARPISMGRWVPGVGVDVPPPGPTAAPSLGGI